MICLKHLHYKIGSLQLSSLYCRTCYRRYSWSNQLSNSTVCVHALIHHSLFAGGASGIALLLGFFFLKESNPQVLDEEGHYHVMKTTKTKTSRIRPKLTSIMVMCFLSEFCVRWALSAYNSRYGFYISDRWQVPSTTFSTVIVFQSVWCAIIQYFIYPWLTSTLGIPIPYLAVVGYVIMIAAYIGMAASPVAWGSLMCSVLLWTGNNLASPSSVAIISVSGLITI